MARLGISIYPEHSTAQRDQAYIRKAGSLGYKRIFTCLLSVGDKCREEVVSEFRLLADTAHECGMEIIPDVSPDWGFPMKTCLFSRRCTWTASGWTRALTA